MVGEGSGGDVAPSRKDHFVIDLDEQRSDEADNRLGVGEDLRTDRHNHRPVAGDSDQAAGLKVLARAHQNLTWDRTRHTNRLRNDLREFFPAALVAFDSLADRDAVAALTKAPNPDQARQLSIAQIRYALKRGGRQRNLDGRAVEIQQALRSPQLAAPPAVAVAAAATTKTLVEVIAGLNEAIAELETELATHFDEHPDADIYLYLPGLGVVLGARVLAEFGHPDRYDTAKSRGNYAGTSPLTITSGKKHAGLARHVRHRRLYDAIDQWAFCSLQTSFGCREFYDHRRAAGDLHHQALRALGNRLVGYLHGCHRARTHYNEHTAWAHRQPAHTQTAA